jgi:hypothetical protein
MVDCVSIQVRNNKCFKQRNRLEVVFPAKESKLIIKDNCYNLLCGIIDKKQLYYKNHNLVADIQRLENKGMLKLKYIKKIHHRSSITLIMYPLQELIRTNPK